LDNRQSFSGDKSKANIAGMFNKIAYRYDFLNHLLSLGIDKYWRKRSIANLKQKKPIHILDIATGTGDFAIEAAKISDSKITGVDISENMLSIARSKVEKKGLTSRIIFQIGDSEHLEFDKNSFHAVTVAFGVRNFENLDCGLSEIYRVLKPEGVCIILEFSSPENPIVKKMYRWYSYYILPQIGAIFSASKSAYTYLPASVNRFPSGKKFAEHLKNAGFKYVSVEAMTFGIVSIYSAIK
jgi:demethylmenaquinone methyltransferase / 2-methoxy-6-polyprenyl-1,4-benzoquinol methylase